MKFMPPPPITVLAFEPVNITVSSPAPPTTVSVFVTDTRFVKLASFSVSLPLPRSTLPFITAVPNVIVSLPVPPISSFHIFHCAGVAAGSGEGQLVCSSVRSTDMEVVSAPVSVTLSAPVPPMTVPTLATVAVLVKLPNVSVSFPDTRSMLAFCAAAPSVMVSLPVPPVIVSTFFTVPVLVPVASVSLSLPAPRSIAIEVVSHAT